MSAGFTYQGRTYWGTNGAVELCLDTMIELAADVPTPADDSVAAFLREERLGFFMGKVVPLDEIASDPGARVRVAELLAAAMERMLQREGALTPVGRRWVETELAELRTALTHTG